MTAYTYLQAVDSAFCLRAYFMGCIRDRLQMTPSFPIKGPYVAFVNVDFVKTSRIDRVSIGMSAWDIKRYYAASSTELVLGGTRVEAVHSEGGLT